MSECNCYNMFVAVTLAAVCLAGHATAAIAPRDHKVYFDVNDADNLYKNYLQEYKKQYTVEEYGKRLEIFKETLKKINERNAMYPQTVFGLTKFSDLTQEEKNSYSCAVNHNSTDAVKLATPLGMTYEENFDWRDKGVVSPVKNQGGCGSCYIFSAIGSIEGQYALKHQQCLSFSEQQALDCTANNGCDGGYPHEVMDNLAGNTAGLMLESDYPYIGSKGTCTEDANKKRATVLGGQTLSVHDEEALKQNLVDGGPLAVNIFVSGMMDYRSGIYEDVDSCTQSLHAVLLVGYGEENGKPYWIIKNSWDTTFGEQGYLRLIRGVKACGITQYVATSQVA